MRKKSEEWTSGDKPKIEDHAMTVDIKEVPPVLSKKLSGRDQKSLRGREH